MRNSPAFIALRRSAHHAFCIAALLIGQAHAQDAPPSTPNPFFTEAADCTAAFQARVVTRMTQAKSDARDKAILRDTELGFVFIGVAYKEGLRNPEADQMLKAAEKRWGLLPKAEQERRLGTCATRAQALMDDVSTIERFIVKNRAQARVERLMEREESKKK